MQSARSLQHRAMLALLLMVGFYVFAVAVAGALTGMAAGESAPSAWPQLAQKRASARFGSPQCGQVAANAVPQLSQNRLPLRFSVPQDAQIIQILR